MSLLIKMYNTVKKSTRSIIGMIALIGVIASPTFAAPTNAELLATLQAQLAQLRAQIDALIQAQANVQTTQQQVRGTLGLIRNLREGMTGKDVKKLQELLAEDQSIYPEGRITGFFGKLTAKAIKKFQARHGLDQVGFVGPKTLAKLNEQFGRHDDQDNEGVDHEGKPCAIIPPGHLIAPGYLKKHEDEDTPTIPPCQILPPGIAKKLHPENGSTTPDTISPILSLITASSTTATTSKITWTTDEPSTSKVWYSNALPLLITPATAKAGSMDLLQSHVVSLGGLNASTTYYYLVVSNDASQNTATSTIFLFLTL